MKQNRAAWLDLVKRVEGEAFADDPRDPGGACRFGVTIPTLAAWRRQPVTADDIRKLTWEESCGLYSARYWGACQGDKLPPGLDVAVADMAVHSGVQRAAKTLQRVLGCEQDGHIGPETLEACRRAKLPDILHSFRDARLGFLRQLPAWTTFGVGWAHRVETVHAVAASLAQAQEAEAPEPTPRAKSRINAQAVVAAAGAVVAAGPSIKDAYVQTTQATAPLAELASWLPVAIGLLVAALTIGMLARRGLKLADQQ